MNFESNIKSDTVMIPEINKRGERGEKETRKENSFHCKKLLHLRNIPSIYSYGPKILDQNCHANNAYFVLHLTVIQLSPNRIAANFLTCFTLCHVSHAAMQLLTFLACLFMGNDPLSCKCMGLMVYADHNNTPSSTQSSLGLN